MRDFYLINLCFDAKQCVHDFSTKPNLHSFIKIFQKTPGTGIFAYRNIRFERQLVGSDVCTSRSYGSLPYQAYRLYLHLRWEERKPVHSTSCSCLQKGTYPMVCCSPLKSVRCSAQEYKLRFSKTRARVATCLYIYQHKKMIQL